MDADPLLKTRQVAAYLGVSVSTAKRWIDSGQIQATRTVGKHRLVPRSSVVRFAARGQFAAEKLAASPVPTPVEPVMGRVEELVPELERALRVADADAATRLITGVLSGRGAAALGDQLLRPVMERIGHGWMIGSWEVFEEHRATQIIAGALQKAVVEARQPGAANRPLAVGATPEGDTFVLPGLLCELTLVETGWEVQNLGVNLPLPSLAEAVRRLRPRLAFLSASHLADPDRFIREYSYFYEAAVQAGTAIIIGGRALDPEIRPRLIFASCGDRLVHLAEFARRLLATIPAT